MKKFALLLLLAGCSNSGNSKRWEDLAEECTVTLTDTIKGWKETTAELTKSTEALEECVETTTSCAEALTQCVTRLNDK